MSAIKEAIKSANRLSRLRMGNAVFEYIEFESLAGDDGPVRLAQVPLSEAEVQQGILAAASVELPATNNMAEMTARNRAAQVSDVWYSLRTPDDLSVKAFESADQLAETLSPTEIDRAVDSLAVMMDYASPALDGISEEDLEELKKNFAKTDWSELSGRRWAAVKLCCQVLLPELLQVKLSGSTSTESSTQRSEESAST
jgi:hypothetical protein